MGHGTSKETKSQSTGITQRLFWCFRKTTAVAHPPVLLSVRIEHLVSHFKKFLEIFYCKLLLKFVGIFKCYLKSAENTDTLREDIPYFNLLKTERRQLYLKAQSVPRCKHFSSRL
jgi:hypothetical protein